MRTTTLVFALALLPLGPATAEAPPGTPPPPRALVGGTLVDGTGAPPVRDAVVLIRAGKVDCAGTRAACPIPEGVAVTDVSGLFVTPGLVDAHVHFSQTGWADGRPDAVDVRDRHPYEEVEADLKAHPERFLRSYVCSGVTSVFDVGGFPWTLKLGERAENDTRAPRVTAAGPLLSTIDHWLNLPAERQFIHLKDEEAGRAGVRYLAAQGAKAVKLWYIVSKDRTVEASAPAVMAAGDEARKAGLPLIVHATGLAEAKVAMKAGARLLVHSVWDKLVDDEFLDLAKKGNVIYCPTLTVLGGYTNLLEARSGHRAPSVDDPNGCVDKETLARIGETAALPAGDTQAAAARLATASERNRTADANLKRVRDAGITIAMGTDAGNPMTLHGPSVYAEMEAMQAAGMSPMEVVVASTRGGSLAMGREKEIGTVEKGKWADLLVVAGDPTRSVANLRKVKQVVRGGVLRSLEELRAGVTARAEAASPASASPAPLSFAISFPKERSATPLDGRVLLLISNDGSGEPRNQINEGLKTQQVFGVDVDGLAPGTEAVVDASALGYPLESLSALPKGTYFVQALLHRYETFHRADGHVVKLPMDRGEGQHWNKAPGNLTSKPRPIALDPSRGETIPISLDQVIPPIPDPPATKFVRHERIRSERLSKFWGRDITLGAHVLLPLGFDEHPNARYPLVVFHGHFPDTIGHFRETPPDPNLKPEYSERFHWPAYNRTEEEQSYQLYKDWTSPGFPRVLVVEIQHANPYYDDSYAVNSANLGPYGDAIQYELIPYLEKKYRALGAGWARFVYGGSTGGWEALAVQVLHPDDYNGAWVACPDPIDFRAYTVVDIYQDRNAYRSDAPWKRTPRPGIRNSLGHVAATLEELNRMELVLGTKGRSGEQWDIWQAVYSPVGADGYPKPIWDKKTGVIDRDVAAYWKEHFDLSNLMSRDWETGLGKKLEGKIHLYVGEADNYYLNDSVYLVEEFLKKAKNPPSGAEVDYEPRAEHCWNGDHTRPNAISRLRYHQMYLPKIVERIRTSAPKGADLTSWSY